MAALRLPHEYLVTCRGKPSINCNSAEPVMRPDAVTRITKAAISQGCCIHLLFEDASLLSLGPGPLGRNGWGIGLETSQGSLEHLFRDAFAGMSIQGVQFKPGDRYASTRRARVHELLSENEVARFARVVELHENGHPLPLLQKPSASANKSKRVESADCSTQGVLFVIGGVRDVYSTERESIQEVSKEFGIPYLAGLSVPGRAELTSKLIKFLEVLDANGVLAKAVQQVCEEVESGRLRDTPDLNIPAETEQPAQHNNTTTNVIICLDEILADFVQNPLATTLLVDLFMGSHTSHRGVTLSLLGSDGNALTLKHGGRCLLESDGFEVLRSAHKNAFQSTLKSLLGSMVACAPRRSPTSSCRRSVLHMDSKAPALKMPQESCMKTASRSGHEYMTVIFASSCQKELVANAVRDSRACSDDGCYAYASAGDLVTGPAFLGMLGNEGWLASAIRASKGPIISRAAPSRNVKAASCAPRVEQRNHAGAQHHISLDADNLALAAQPGKDCAKAIDARADALSASDGETSAGEQEPSLSATDSKLRSSLDDSTSISGMSTGLDACSSGDEDSAINEEALGLLDLEQHGAAPQQVIKVSQPAAFVMQANGRPKLQLKKRDPSLGLVGVPPMVASLICQCGAEQAITAKFCGRCGARVRVCATD